MRFLFFAVLVLTGINANAGGIEAIQLDHVAIDVSLKCDRVFFRSTQHQPGIIYALPRVIPATDENFEHIAKVIKNARNTPGKPYVLTFSLYFPRDDEEIKARSTFDDAALIKACSFDQVKNYLNNYQASSKIAQVHTVASMPITSFEVSIPDFVAQSKLVGRVTETGDADIIEYQGKTFNFNYEITETEARAIREAQQAGDGIYPRVRFKFQARRRDGSLSVKLDTSQLAANFEAAANGSYGKIAKGQISTTLQTALKNTKLDINSQAGSGDFNVIAAKIIDSVLAELKLTVKDLVPGENRGQVENPTDEVSVKVVADIIRSKVSANIEYNNVKATEEASAESVLKLNTGSLDPNVTQVRVVSGEGDVVVPEEIFKGQKIHIIPSHNSQIFIEYRPTVSYLSVDQMKKDEYSHIFRQLFNDGRYKIADEQRHGFQVGTATPYLMTETGSYYFPSGYLFTKYIWRRIERSPVITRSPRQPMGPELEEFDRFPVTISFSKVGNQRKRFTFRQLLELTNDPKNKYWSAEQNPLTGAITLTAKEDLGLMVFRERFKFNEKNNDSLAEGAAADVSDFVKVVEKSEVLVKEKHTSYSDTDITEFPPIVIRQNTKAVVQRRMVFFNLTKEPAAGE